MTLDFPRIRLSNLRMNFPTSSGNFFSDSLELFVSLKVVAKRRSCVGSKPSSESSRSLGDSYRAHYPGRSYLVFARTMPSTTTTTAAASTTLNLTASSSSTAEEQDIYDEIEIEDMTYDSTLQIYHYPCPCGDRFEIAIADLRDGQDVAVCPSCSLMIKVIFDLEDLPKSKEENKDGKAAG